MKPVKSVCAAARRLSRKEMKMVTGGMDRAAACINAVQCLRTCPPQGMAECLATYICCSRT